MRFNKRHLIKIKKIKISYSEAALLLLGALIIIQCAVVVNYITSIAAAQPNAISPKPSSIPKASVIAQNETNRAILIVDTHYSPAPGSMDGFAGDLNAIYPADYKNISWKRYTADFSNKFQLIILSPQATPWPNYPRDELNRFYYEFHRTTKPILGLCGGHQLIALAYGGKVVPIKGQIPECSYPATYRLCNSEKGFTEINFDKKNPDPIFKGIDGGKAVVWMNHVEEITILPPDFQSIAYNGISKVQAMRNKTGRIYGLQFHPEESDAAHPQGAMIFRNAVELLINKNPK